MNFKIFQEKQESDEPSEFVRGGVRHTLPNRSRPRIESDRLADSLPDIKDTGNASDRVKPETESEVETTDSYQSPPAVFNVKEFWKI